MKQTKTKLLCLILTALMLLSGLTACGKDKEGKDSNLIKLGDYELLYKGACIMEDSDGNDAIVLTLDFTNNSKENASYLWSVDETVMQNGVELEAASIITDYENLETVVSDQFTDVAPGATLEVRTAFVLKDTTSEVKATFEEFLGSKKGTITVDPATLSRETVSHTEPETTNTTGDTLLDWWNGEWYGWWKMSGCRLTPLSAVILEEPALQQTPRVALCKMLHKMVCLHHKDDRHNEQRDQNKQHRGGQRHHGNQVHAADVSHKERRHHRAEQRPAQRVERQAKLEHQHKPNGKRHNDRKCRDLRVRQIQRPLKQRQKQNAKNHRQGRGERFLQNVR